MHWYFSKTQKITELSPPVILLVRVATPDAFVTDKFPVNANPEILCVPVPPIVIWDEPAVKVPLLRKFPPNVKAKLFVANDEELPVILRGALITRVPFSVKPPLTLATITPPEPTQVAGNSIPVV